MYFGTYWGIPRTHNPKEDPISEEHKEDSMNKDAE